LAGGQGSQGGISLPQLSVLDVAPTLLYSLGLPIPEDLEGRLASELFEPSVLKVAPPHIGEPTLDPGSLREAKSQVAMESEGEAQVVDRLRALGYLE
jgi:arylsulfatase A-like enzyme